MGEIELNVLITPSNSNDGTPVNLPDASRFVRITYKSSHLIKLQAREGNEEGTGCVHGGSHPRIDLAPSPNQFRTIKIPWTAFRQDGLPNGKLLNIHNLCKFNFVNYNPVSGAFFRNKISYPLILRNMKTRLYLLLLTALFFSNNGYSQKKIDINGVWEDINPGVQNAVAIVSEQNGKVIFSHYLEWKGQKFVESGTGKRTGNTIVYTVDVTLPIKGWATQGTHTLTLSEDGNTLEGTFIDNKKRTGPIAFKRVR